jgi:hypothetical protein
LEWEDDFSDFDQTRWEKSDNHTWGGNQSILIEENAVFVDGMLVLCMTDDNHLGFVDVNPPALLWARQIGSMVMGRFSEEINPPEPLQNILVSPGSVLILFGLLPINEPFLFISIVIVLPRAQTWRPYKFLMIILHPIH